MAEKEYELRKLCAKDIFPMVSLISKIGVNKFAKCFESEGVLESMEDDGDATAVGIEIALEIANVVCENLGNAEQELYQFLAGISNLKKSEVEKLSMAAFLQMIIDVIMKEEFKDFFKVVSGLLTKGK